MPLNSAVEPIRSISDGELVDLGLDRRAVGARQRAVLELHGQLADALQHRVDLGQRALRRLHERDGVLHVALGLIEALIWPRSFSLMASPAASSAARLMR